MALDANGNAHIISDAVTPLVLLAIYYYKKLSSATGNTSSSLQYDNQRAAETHTIIHQYIFR